MDRPDTTINDLSSLLAELDKCKLVPGVNDREFDDLHDQLDSFPVRETYMELLSWIDTLEQLCKSNNLPN